MPPKQAGDKPGKCVLVEIIGTFQSPGLAMEAEFRELIDVQAGPIYGTSPDHPGKIVEKRPDGSQVVGMLRGRQFIADEAPASFPRLSSLR